MTRNDASRVDPVPALEPSRSNPNDLAVAPAVAVSPVPAGPVEPTRESLRQQFEAAPAFAKCHCGRHKYQHYGALGYCTPGGARRGYGPAFTLDPDALPDDELPTAEDVRGILADFAPAASLQTVSEQFAAEAALGAAVIKALATVSMGDDLALWLLGGVYARARVVTNDPDVEAENDATRALESALAAALSASPTRGEAR